MASTATKTPKKKASSKAAVSTPRAKQAPAKRVAKKRTSSKTLKSSQASAKKPGLPSTRVIAHKDVGWGNALYIRGEGDGLSWEKGILMKSKNASEWHWTSKSAKGALSFKLLVNDTTWASGENLSIKAGSTWEGSPHFD